MTRFIIYAEIALHIIFQKHNLIVKKSNEYIVGQWERVECILAYD